MMWHTHAAMGASSVWLLMPLVPTGDSAVLAMLMTFALVGALAPDLDAIESKIKHIKVIGIKPLVLVAKAINRDFGHRGLLHSLWGWVGWTLLVSPVGITLCWLPVLALSLGYASHLMGDAGTWTGIPLLYPERKPYHLLPKRLLVTTGLEWEDLFFVAFALFSIVPLVSRPRV